MKAILDELGNPPVLPLGARRSLFGQYTRGASSSGTMNRVKLPTTLSAKQSIGHKSPSATQHDGRVNPTKMAVAYEKAERNSRLVEALIDHKADGARDVKVYHVLGDHGLCGTAAGTPASTAGPVSRVPSSSRGIRLLISVAADDRD